MMLGPYVLNRLPKTPLILLQVQTGEEMNKTSCENGVCDAQNSKVIFNLMSISFPYERSWFKKSVFKHSMTYM